MIIILMSICNPCISWDLEWNPFILSTQFHKNERLYPLPFDNEGLVRNSSEFWIQTLRSHKGGHATAMRSSWVDSGGSDRRFSARPCNHNRRDRSWWITSTFERCRGSLRKVLEKGVNGSSVRRWAMEGFPINLKTGNSFQRWLLV